MYSRTTRLSDSPLPSTPVGFHTVLLVSGVPSQSSPSCLALSAFRGGGQQEQSTVVHCRSRCPFTSSEKTELSEVEKTVVNSLASSSTSIVILAKAPTKQATVSISSLEPVPKRKLASSSSGRRCSADTQKFWLTVPNVHSHYAPTSRVPAPKALRRGATIAPFRCEQAISRAGTADWLGPSRFPRIRSDCQQEEPEGDRLSLHWITRPPPLQAPPPL